MQNKYSIPPRSNPKWKALLNGEIDISLKNFFFQMKVTQVKNQIKNGILPIDTAVDDIVTLCKKFRSARHMKDDLEAIFGKDLVISTVVERNSDYKNEPNEDIADLNKKITFFKNALEKKTKDLKEKEKLILSLQEEVVLQKRKYEVLLNGVDKIKESKVEDNKNNWSFFKLFK